jgi:ATP-dependent protease HslVU (ClpYQ) peptidase subunit
MTTIAWDGRTLAADRRAHGSGFMYAVTKIRRTPDGRLIGVAGNVSAVMAMLDWLEGGAEGEPPLPLTSDAWSDMIEIDAGGAAYLWGDHGRYRIHDKIAAIGSGMPYALGAMACGRCARSAILVAARFDPGTGTPIDTLSLKPPRC